MALMSAMLTWGVITQRWPKPDIVFEIPNGWLDVSSVGPPANYERLPAELRARVRATAGGLKRYAIDVDHADFEREGFAAFGAGYVHGDGDVSEASVREYARQALAEAGVSDGRITAVEVRSIGSARMGRAVIDVESLGMRLYFYTFAKGRTFARMSCSMPSISLGELGVVAVFLHGLIALLVTGK